MRVVCITHTPELYGANLSMLAWLRELKARGHSFLVVGPNGPIVKACADLGIDFFPFQPPWWAAAPGTFRSLTLVRSLFMARFGHRNLADRAARFGPDWIYSNSGVTPLGWILARRLKKPHVWHLREFIDLDFGYELALGWFLARRAFAGADFTISVSQAVRAHLIFRPTEHDAVIYEGIGSREELSRRARSGDSFPVVTAAIPFRFILVGMLQASKGQDLAIRSFAILRSSGRSARLVLVGGGPAAPLRQLAVELGVADTVEFTGHLADPAASVLAAHAALMFSRAEAFGRTTVEAMSLGRPVIALRRGASPELIVDGETGLLCEPTPEALSAAMARLIDAPDFAAALGRRAAIAAQRYSNEAYADGIERLFERPALSAA